MQHFLGSTSAHPKEQDSSVCLVDCINGLHCLAAGLYCNGRQPGAQLYRFNRLNMASCFSIPVSFSYACLVSSTIVLAGSFVQKQACNVTPQSGDLYAQTAFLFHLRRVSTVFWLLGRARNPHAHRSPHRRPEFTGCAKHRR